MKLRNAQICILTNGGDMLCDELGFTVSESVANIKSISENAPIPYSSASNQPLRGDNRSGREVA